MSINQHTRIVRTLYRKLLNQHKKLPLDIQAVGMQYIRDEFKRHKGADPNQAQIFLNEWRIFSEMLDDQLDSGITNVGTNIQTDKLNNFSDEQISQLYELQQAAIAEEKEET